MNALDKKKLNDHMIERLRVLACERNLSFTQVALYSGVPLGTIHNCLYTPIQLVKLASFFRVSIDYLVGVTEER